MELTEDQRKTAGVIFGQMMCRAAMDRPMYDYALNPFTQNEEWDQAMAQADSYGWVTFAYDSTKPPHAKVFTDLGKKVFEQYQSFLEL